MHMSFGLPGPLWTPFEPINKNRRKMLRPMRLHKRCMPLISQKCRKDQKWVSNLSKIYFSFSFLSSWISLTWVWAYHLLFYNFRYVSIYFIYIYIYYFPHIYDIFQISVFCIFSMFLICFHIMLYFPICFWIVLYSSI